MSLPLSIQMLLWHYESVSAEIRNSLGGKGAEDIPHLLLEVCVDAGAGDPAPREVTLRVKRATGRVTALTRAGWVSQPWQAGDHRVCASCSDVSC